MTKEPKGIYVGEFNEIQLRNGEDKIAVEQKKKETGLNYTNTRITKKSIKIWVCSVSDFEI